MEITANIDYKKLAIAFNKIPIVAARELRIEMKKATRTVVVDAKMHHRFKTKSGNLENSIQDLVSDDGLTGIVHFNEGKATYGKYQHDGTHTKSGRVWIRPDKFLYAAADRQKPFFLARIQGAVKRIFDSVGL